MKSTLELNSKQGKNVYWIDCTNKNELNETMLIELVRCEGSTLQRQWKKNGHMDYFIESWWSVKTYVTDESGDCCGKYNPQHNNGVLNFDYVLDANYDNAVALLKECEKRFVKGGN